MAQRKVARVTVRVVEAEEADRITAAEEVGGAGSRRLRR